MVTEADENAPTAATVGPPLGIISSGASTSDAASSASASSVVPLKRSVPVPSTDLRSALRTIDNETERLILGRSSGGGGSADRADGDRGDDDGSGGCGDATPPAAEQRRLDDAVADAKLAAARSLRTNLCRIARPADDDEHEGRLGKAREEMMLDRALRRCDGGGSNFVEDEEDDDGSDVSSEEDVTSDEEEEVEGEEEDEEEMLDRDALARAQALREEVRAAAARVASKRDGVTRRAVELVRREVEAVRATHGGEDGDGTADAAAAGEEVEEEDAARLSSMREALESLERSAGGVDGTLPERIATLRSTVDTVSAALDRSRRRREEGDDKVLSQTELAILSKPEEEAGMGVGDEEDGARRMAEEEEVAARVRAMEPGERFAVFMSRTAA